MPSRALEICALYCFFLDEFVDMKSFNQQQSKKEIPKQHKILEKYSKKTSILGADCSTIKCCSKSKQYIVGSNIISQTSGIHYWKFGLNANNIKCTVAIRLLRFITLNDKKLDLVEPSYGSMEELPQLNEPPLQIEMYFNSDSCNLIYSVNGIKGDQIKFPKSQLSETKYRVLIEMNAYEKVEKKSIIKVELLSYQSSEICLNVIHDKNNVDRDILARTYIDYAELHYNIQSKMKYTEKALKIYPLHDEWNSNYIGYLLKREKYDKAFNFVMEHQKGQLGIANLAGYYDDEKDFKTASLLYDLLDDGTLSEGCCSLIIGVCKQKNGEYNKALKLFYKQMDNPGDDNEVLTVCKIHIGCVHYELEDFKFVLKMLVQLDDDNLFSYFLREISNDSEKKSKFENFITKAKNLDPEQFDVSQTNYDKRVNMLLGALHVTDGNREFD